MRTVNYEVILKKVNGFIASKPQSTTHKEFVNSFKGVLSAKEANKFWDRLVILGNVLSAVDKTHYKWLVNSNFFTMQSIEKHFRQGMVLSTRGRIPGKKYPKKENVQKNDSVVVPMYSGWNYSVTL